MNDFLSFSKPFICLVRHGETAAAKAGRMNGVREEPLTEMGELQASSLQAPLNMIAWDRVLCSPLQRVRRTAELAGFPSPEIIPDLIEFDCGDFEGLTSAEIRSTRPNWDFWRDGCEGGETSESAGIRVDRVLACLAGGSGTTLIFCHAATSRIFAARFLGLPGHMASAFDFQPAHIGVLGRRSNPAIFLWNDGSHLPSIHKSDNDLTALPH